MGEVLTQRQLKVGTIKKAAELLKIIGHPIRLHILLILEERVEMTVTELLQSLHETIEQSLLSHHLIKMKNAQILTSEKRGMCVYYKILDTRVLKIFDCIENSSL